MRNNCYIMCMIANVFAFQLMARPQQLYLAPQETYPGTRPIDQQPEGSAQLAEDMPQMAAFVYDFYVHKVQAIKSAMQVNVK
jgi:hypothetical protein